MALFNTLRDAKIAWKKAGGLSSDKSKFNYNKDGKFVNAFTGNEVSRATATDDTREVAESIKNGGTTPSPTPTTTAAPTQTADEKKLADYARGQASLLSDKEFENWLDNNNDLLLEQIATGQISLSAAKKQVNWSSIIGQSSAEPTADTGEQKLVDENGNEYFGNVFTNRTTGQKTDAFGKPLTVALTDPETGEIVKEELTALPDAVTSSEDFQLLSPEQQAQVLKYFNFMVTGSEQEQTAFLELIDEARAFAEPQFKTEMRFTADAIADNLAAITGDHQISAERFRKNLDEIQEDIKSGAEQLTIEEENALRRQAQNYRNQLDNLASRGLVSSTFRTETEDERRRTRESTTREFARTRQQIDRQARAKARELEQQFGTLGSQRILQGQDPITGEAIEGAQNVQQFGLGDFFLGAGKEPDIRGVEAERRATETFRFAGALEPLNPTLNPLL